MVMVQIRAIIGKKLFDIMNSQCSSGVEQLFCKQPVVGSNPATGSLGGYQSGQLGQTVNLLA